MTCLERNIYQNVKSCHADIQISVYFFGFYWEYLTNTKVTVTGIDMLTPDICQIQKKCAHIMMDLESQAYF